MQVVAPEKANSTIKLVQSEFKELDSLDKLSQCLIEMACDTSQKMKKDNMILVLVDLKKLNQSISF